MRECISVHVGQVRYFRMFQVNIYLLCMSHLDLVSIHINYFDEYDYLSLCYFAKTDTG